MGLLQRRGLVASALLGILAIRRLTHRDHFDVEHAEVFCKVLLVHDAKQVLRGGVAHFIELAQTLARLVMVALGRA